MECGQVRTASRKCSNLNMSIMDVHVILISNKYTSHIALCEFLYPGRRGRVTYVTYARLAWCLCWIALPRELLRADAVGSCRGWGHP